MSVTTRRENRALIVTLDNPPVNAIGREMREGLMEAVRTAEAEMLDRVIVTGAGRAFAAGADAREFDGPPAAPHLPDVVDAIDRSFVPWVAAVNGIALGGGAEIALGCRMRIMAPGAQIGLPEVTLGVIPGAGGTQRLPRLVGLERALGMIAFGKPVGAEAALAMGLVHAVEEDPVEAALMENSEALGCIVPTWELPAPEADAAILAAIRERVAAKSAGQEAPPRAIDAVEAGLSLPFEEGMASERAIFFERRDSDQSKALRHIFFAERAAKPPEGLADGPAALDHVAVVGGGTMGAGIAYALLNAGIRVTLVETDAEAAERAAGNVERIVEASRARGLVDEAGARARRARLAVTADMGQASDATLAIEAAFESMDVKREVFAALEAALPADALLATNTSYLDVDEIARGLADPSRVLGLHFFAPAHIMRLLEIVRGAATSDRAIATGFALAKRLRKVPVVAGVCDGFIGNRILTRYREAADAVMLAGAAPWEVDEAMVGFGYAMGPYETQDLSGLDIGAAARAMRAERGLPVRPNPVADRMIELGKLGRKTGAGWYRYPGGGGKVDDPIVADLAIEEARLAGTAQREFSDGEIRERLVLAMVNEAAAILREGIARSARDIDLVTVFGYGFPRWRGGLMHHADTLGGPAIAERLRELEAEDPAYAPDPLLLRCAEDGIRLADARP